MAPLILPSRKLVMPRILISDMPTRTRCPDILDGAIMLHLTPTLGGARFDL